MSSLTFKVFRSKTPSGGTFCCVPGCANKSSKHKLEGKKLSYYRFPLQDQKRMKLWLAQIRRDDWYPKSYERICSIHFEGGKKSNKPTDPGFTPTVFPARQKPVKKRTTNAARRAEAPLTPPATPTAKRRLIIDSQPRRLIDSQPRRLIDSQPRRLIDSQPRRLIDSQPRRLIDNQPRRLIDSPPQVQPLSPHAEEPASPMSPDTTSIDPPFSPDDTLPHLPAEVNLEDTPLHSPPVAATKMDHDYLSTFRDPSLHSDEFISLQQEVHELRSSNHQLKQKVLCIDTFKNNDEDFRYMTSLSSYTQFKGLSKYLYKRCGGYLKYWQGQDTMKFNHFAMSSKTGKKPGPERKLSFEEEFFMVLVKLQCGLDNKDLSLRLRLSESFISKTITTWINFLNNELTILFELPPVELSNIQTMPCFDDFPDVQIVLDCTELFTQRSSDLQARKETFSNCKNHDTVKFLVGMSPFQSVNFVSIAWGRRATDKHITLSSDDLLASLPPGSNVMADRGFLVTEELQKLGVKMIMPHFKGRNMPQFTADEATASAKISNARVHIERVIQRIKTFHILERCVRLNQRDTIEQTFRVCAYLCNLQPPIVKLC